METMQDVRIAMSKLYDKLETGELELKIAGELANIAGKFLKAEQLELAREIFYNQKGTKPVAEKRLK